MVTIIIPVYNNFELTKKCIFSIYKNTQIINFNIIIIDNASTDDTFNFFTSHEFKNLKIIRNNKNEGFAFACNQAALLSSKAYLVFLNNDTEVSPFWVNHLIELASNDFRIGVLGAKLLYPDNSIQHAGVAFSSQKVHHIYRNFHHSHPAVNKQREFQAVTGACMLVPRKLFISLGGFDESFMNGFEDVDFCFRVRSKGAKIVYAPKCVVTHHESKTTGRHDHHAHNARLFATRWSNCIVHDIDYIYANDGLKKIKNAGHNFSAKWFKDSNPNPFFERATLLTQKGNTVIDEQMYLDALSFNPYDIRNIDIALQLGNFYTKLKRYSDAIKCFEAVDSAKKNGTNINTIK